ncbi:MAG: DEAD/DEAH box helicase [Pseudomonadota bacterium]
MTIDPTNTQALPEPQRTIIEVLAVAQGGLTLTMLCAALAAAGQLNRGRRFTTATLAPHLDQLEQRRLLLREGRPDLTRELREPLCRALQAEGRFVPLARAVAVADPLPAPSHWSWEVRPAPLERELRAAVYAGDARRFLEIERLVGRWGSDGSIRMPTMGAWLPRPLSPQALLALGPQIAPRILDQISADRHTVPRAEPGLMDSLEALCRAHPHAQGLRLCLGRELILAGELARAAALLAGAEGPTAQALQALLALGDGRVDEASKLYAKAIAALRKERQGQTVLLPGVEGVFLPLAYLLQGSASRRKQAETMLDGVLDRFHLGPGSMLAAFVHWDRLPPLLDGESLPEGGAVEHPIAVLAAALVSHWAGRAPDRARLSQSAEQADAAELGWIAAQLRSLAEDTPPPAGALARLREPERDWERRLRALEDSLVEQGSAAPDAGPSERVAWLLFWNGRELHLEARIQKGGDKGWSRGRKVAASRLHSDPAAVPGMGEQDLRIAACLTIVKARGWYGGYADDEERWDAERAWPVLAGHPAVFDHHDPDTRLEIVQLAPRLVVQRQAQQITLRVEPEPEDDASLVVSRPRPDRYEFVSFDGPLQRLVAPLRGGLQLPSRAAERLGALLGAAAGSFEIHDEGAQHGTRARDLPHDPRPLLRLFPQGGGLSVQVLARPFGAAGPVVEPGRGGQVLIAQIDGETCRVQRDLAEEERRLAELVQTIPALEVARLGGQARPWEDLNEALELLVELHRQGDRLRMEWPEGERLKLHAELGERHLRISLHSVDQWFEAQGALEVDGELVLQLHELLDRVGSRSRRFIQLDDGRWLALTESLRRQLDLLARLDQGRGKTTRVHPLAASALQPLCDAAGHCELDQAWMDRAAAQQAAMASTPTLPRTLQAELRPYQREGFTWMARLAALGAGACLADDMGLGKTVQALALLLHRAAQGPALVIAPTSVCGGWCEQAWRFAPSLAVRRYGPGDRQAAIDALGPGDVLVASYGLVQGDVELLSRVRWSTLVLDEAQAIKNPGTQRHAAVRKLTADFRLATTGTPVENHLGEIWAIFQVLEPGLLGSWERFRARFAMPVESGDREVQLQLRRLLLPFILRRTKAAVLQDLPQRTDIQVDVALHPEERALYEALRQRAVQELENLPEGPAPLQILAQLTRLRMACCHPALVLEARGQALPSAKLEALLDIVERLRDGGHRALIFSQFVSHLALLRAELDRLGVLYQYLDGATPATQRDQRVRAFQAGEGDLFLISLRAGGFGLNLTAADFVVHMDPWWNPAVEDQASDRAHRIGQTRPVTVYRLVAQDTIEEKIVALHQHKRDLADQLLAEADAASRLSTEALMALLREGGAVSRAP